VATESILISEVIPASPQRIFSAWMDSVEHSAFTGEEATVVPIVGGEHRAAGGYIQGRTLELHEGSRIVQSWRTTEFPADSPDSRLEVTLEPTLGGTLVTLLHTDIPTGQGDRYKQGWNEFYLSRMKVYFASDIAPTGDGSGGDDDGASWEDESSAGATQPAVVRPPASAKRSPAAKRPKMVAAKAAKAQAAKSTAAKKPAKKLAKKLAKKPTKKPAKAAKAKAVVRAKARPKAKAASKPKRAAKAAGRRR
jgi:uncharacterized protein YndB with AHSA1/START domain